MIQSRPYEFMVQFTPQREWVERKGILFWLAFFFIELGAGMFIISSIFSSQLGMLIGWLICAVLGGGLHLLYLGHPLRFWRIIVSSGWKTSWISRGLYFVGLFLILGTVHMIVAHWALPLFGLLITADILALLTVVYVGFVMNYVNGISLWNTPLLPVLYLILGIWGGLGMTLIVLLATGTTALASTLEGWSRVFLLAFIFIVLIYFLSIRYQGATAKLSVKQMVMGKWALLFWIMVVTLAMLLPVGVALSNWLADLEIPVVLLYVVITFELLGDLALRYCILSCGLYAPLIPGTGYGFQGTARV